MDKEGPPPGGQERVIGAKEPRGDRSVRGKILEIVPETGSRRIGNGGDIRGGQGRAASGPQAPPTMLHSIQSTQAHKEPHRGGEGGGGGKQEPKGGTGERGGGQGRGDLGPNRQSDWTVPKRVAPRRSDGSCREGARTGPWGETRARDGIDGETPQGLFQGIGAGEAPNRAKGGVKGSELGRPSRGGHIREGKAQESGMASNTERPGGGAKGSSEGANGHGITSRDKGRAGSGGRGGRVGPSESKERVVKRDGG